MKFVDNIPIWGDPIDEGALAQIKTCAKTADKVALMADHHKGYAVPIGGVVAYENHISPSGVGYDIACGNKAVLTDLPGTVLRTNIKPIMDKIWKEISFGIGRRNNSGERMNLPFEIPETLDVFKQSPSKHYQSWRRMAEEQLGTVGSGNHYVDLFIDEQDRVWIGVHFGSRGFGHKIASWFLAKAGATDAMDAEPCILDINSDLGQQYLNAMELAGAYAYAGRSWVCNKVASILDASITQEVHNHHNFAWWEDHNGRALWVVRKGATPAFPGQLGFVGGSMGDLSVILEGVKNDEAIHSLYSTVHGAGRIMGRMEAKGKIDRRTGEVKRPGKVTEDMMKEWIDREGVELRGAGLDESPHCYKRLPDVLEAHAGSINILHYLRPIGVAMAGANEFDPYKD